MKYIVLLVSVMSLMACNKKAEHSDLCGADATLNQSSEVTFLIDEKKSIKDKIYPKGDYFVASSNATYMILKNGTKKNIESEPGCNNAKGIACKNTASNKVSPLGYIDFRIMKLMTAEYGPLDLTSIEKKGLTKDEAAFTVTPSPKIITGIHDSLLEGNSDKDDDLTYCNLEGVNLELIYNSKNKTISTTSSYSAKVKIKE